MKRRRWVTFWVAWASICLAWAIITHNTLGAVFAVVGLVLWARVANQSTA